MSATEPLTITSKKIIDDTQECKSCGSSGTGNYCSRCGQSYKIKRITLSALIHDIFHFFTHLEKGFGYTLKQLIVTPGKMQRAYIEGERTRHQKPFSMFFICATVTAVSRYWIYETLLKYYNEGSISEANFFHQYMVILYIFLFPVITLITYLLFYKSQYNYAETGVLLLYIFSFFFLTATLIALLRFIWPQLDTAYIELPVFVFYNAITFVNFYNKSPRWLVAIKSIVSFVILFLIVQYAEDLFIKMIS